MLISFWKACFESKKRRFPYFQTADGEPTEIFRLFALFEESWARQNML